MHPSQRFSYALLLSLALWWPTLQATLGGDVDPIEASLRWVLAFVVARTGVRILGSLVDRYAGVDDEDEPDAEATGSPVDGELPADLDLGDRTAA